MILITGGAFQGKYEFAKRLWQELYKGNPEILNGLHLFIKEKMETAISEHSILQDILMLTLQSPRLIITVNELGCGVVPIEAQDRAYRELCGRICCVLAGIAESVYRVTCGTPMLLIQRQTALISLIRHGQTKGNQDRRYVGSTDIDLTESGRAQIAEMAKKLYTALPMPSALFSSPMKRCLQTCGILFPSVNAQTFSALKETNFGLFEYKNCDELNASKKLAPLWQAWIDSNGKAPFPEGESQNEAADRVCACFLDNLHTFFSKNPNKTLCPRGTSNHSKTGVQNSDFPHLSFVLHDGGIMGILGRLVPKDYFYREHEPYFWKTENGDGYLLWVAYDTHHTDNYVHHIYYTAPNPITIYPISKISALT